LDEEEKWRFNDPSTKNISETQDILTSREIFHFQNRCGGKSG
jgi:hypothetical protein